MNTGKPSKEELDKALRNNPGAALDDSGARSEVDIETPKSVDEIQGCVDFINPDDNSMNSRG